MRTPDQRARDKDRDAAIEIVEAAWVDGQIVEADRDRRVEELLRARTLSEIDLLTRDLQITASSHVAPGAATVTPTESPYGVERKPADLAGLQRVVVASGPKAPRIVGVIVAAVLVAVVGAVVTGIVAVVRTVGESGGDVEVQSPVPGQEKEIIVGIYMFYEA